MQGGDRDSVCVQALILVTVNARGYGKYSCKYARAGHCEYFARDAKDATTEGLAGPVRKVNEVSCLVLQWVFFYSECDLLVNKVIPVQT